MGCNTCKCSIGKLNRKITIQSYSATRSAMGEEVKTWATFTTLWSKVMFKAGGEDEKNDRETSANNVTFMTRYNENVTAKMRVSFESDIYDILYIRPDEKWRFMEIVTRKVDG